MIWGATSKKKLHLFSVGNERVIVAASSIKKIMDDKQRNCAYYVCVNPGRFTALSISLDAMSDSN